MNQCGTPGHEDRGCRRQQSDEDPARRGVCKGIDQSGATAAHRTGKLSAPSRSRKPADHPAKYAVVPPASTPPCARDAHASSVDRHPGSGRAMTVELARSRLAREASVWRFVVESSTFRSRIDRGVTSTASSGRMNSSACSSESGRGGMRRTSSSAEAARTFVSFLGLEAFTSRSSSRAFSPTIIPS